MREKQSGRLQCSCAMQGTHCCTPKKGPYTAPAGSRSDNWQSCWLYEQVQFVVLPAQVYIRGRGKLRSRHRSTCALTTLDVATTSPREALFMLPSCTALQLASQAMRSLARCRQRKHLELLSQPPKIRFNTHCSRLRPFQPPISGASPVKSHRTRCAAHPLLRRAAAVCARSRRMSAGRPAGANEC